MGLRFRRTIRLGRWIRLNVSKSGLSISAGKPGATINVSERGVYGTVGAPGTGLSYREKISLPSLSVSADPQQPLSSENRATLTTESSVNGLGDTRTRGRPETSSTLPASSTFSWSKALLIWGSVVLFLILAMSLKKTSEPIRSTEPSRTLNPAAVPYASRVSVRAGLTAATVGQVPFVYFLHGDQVVLPADLPPTATENELRARGYSARLFTPPCTLNEISLEDVLSYTVQGYRVLDSLDPSNALIQEASKCVSASTPPAKESGPAAQKKTAKVR